MMNVMPERAPAVLLPDDRAPVPSPSHGSARDRFLRLAESRLDRAYRIAGLILGNANEAEDAVQDALAVAWRSLSSLRDDEVFDAWFDRILVNGCRDQMRRRKVVRFIPIDGSVDPMIEDPFATVIARDAVLAPLATLPADEKAIVVLHYWADLTLEAVAERLGIPGGTVRSRLHRALGRMRAHATQETLR
jgi:RNA polymerase sigma-70 factor (ECF subfamily)